ncbi:hypothetical protein BHM03_00060607, partial [Ensete ventricosum]
EEEMDGTKATMRALIDNDNRNNKRGEHKGERRRRATLVSVPTTHRSVTIEILNLSF